MKTITDHFSFVLKPSTIQSGGVGVFALHDIAEGTPMALFRDDFHERRCEVEEVPKELQTYCIDQPDGSLMCPEHFNRMDIGNYLNHSQKSNLRYEEGKGYTARRDIRAGEELFADYRELGEPEETWGEYYTKG